MEESNGEGVLGRRGIAEFSGLSDKIGTQPHDYVEEC